MAPTTTPPRRAHSANAIWTRLWRKLQVLLKTTLGYSQDRTTLGLQASRYWNSRSENRAEESHWRGHGVFADDAVWLELGRRHEALLHRLAGDPSSSRSYRHVIEWGCGGGMNAVHLARQADRYWGVDISQASLDECARQLQLEGLSGFVPVLVDANQPQAALQLIDHRCDLFICTFVFELLPTEAHALELLDVAYQLMAPQAHALIHFRCSDGAVHSRSRPWDYAANMAHNVTFSIHDFTQACRNQGFKVLGIEKQDHLAELDERNYAYFLLQR